MLGLGNITNYSSPKQVGALTNWSSALAGADHTVAVKRDGTLWLWGNNSYGQLGLGNTTNYSSPKQVGALTDWAVVFAGGSHNLAIKTNGTLWAWGSGAFGQLGLGNTTNYSSPKQVGVLTNWYLVGGGATHSISTKTNGTLWAWGRNNFGQLGLNITYSQNRSSPSQIGALTTWNKVSGQSEAGSTVVSKTDGTLWSWGNNNSGQLGLNNITNYSSPKQIGALTTWKTIGIGTIHTLALKTP
jgi:alpha-tubulin suppressor-like RCC1 family protein